MSFTDAELESIADGLRLAGYQIDDFTNDDIARIAEAVLEALEMAKLLPQQISDQ